jgi:hypothetical protein
LAGHDDLAGVTERLGEHGIVTTRGLPVGPCAGEGVVGDPSDQQGVGRAELGVDGLAHLVVEVREVPLLRRLDDAVEGDEQAGADLLHGEVAPA